MKHADTDPVTWGDMKRIYRRLDERISDCFEAVATGDQEQADFWNEHQDKLARMQRALNRLRRTVQDLMQEG